MKESDWAGSFEKSINRGLARWLNKNMGAEKWRLFCPLKLIYTDDTEKFSEDLDREDWLDEFAGDEDQSVGFFTLVWDQWEGQGINVRRQTLALEKAFPGLGFGAMELIESAGCKAVNVHTFHWGFDRVDEWCYGDAVRLLGKHSHQAHGYGGKQMNQEPKMLTIPIRYTLPDGNEGTGWATVSPEISQETLDALRRMMEAAATMDAQWQKGQTLR